uniref:Uncharacterized protein LOC108046043 isoform X1 n=1 Tax=Drosophila rhopaloa TaxID=1041015 RepID=A0A6P4F182_DRORH
MTDLTRRRRTAQQILLRRALSKSVGRCQAATELVPNKGGIVVPPSLTREPQLLNQIRERSSSRAVKKVHRFLAANPFRILQERKAAGKLSGCVLQRKDSRSWRKLKPSDADPTISGHNLKINERSRGSTRSRHSSSTYPSTWQLNVSRAKEELQDNSQGSLEEIINCSILNRTPYDHQLSMPLKSDNSCQCTINKKSRRRGRKTKTVSVAQAQTQTIRESGKKRSLSKSSEVSVQFQRLKQRVYSGEEFSQERKICISPSKISGNSKVSFKCAKTCPGKSYKNFGGYSPSETDIETEAEYHPNLQGPSAYLNKIEEISKPASNVDMKWSHNMPSKTEIQQSMARGSQESERMYKDQDWEIQRKIAKCYCTNARTKENQARSGGVKDIKSIRHGELQQSIPRIGSENRRMNNPNFHDNDQKFQRKYSNCFCTNPRRRDNLVENARAQETMSKKSSVDNSFNSLNGYSMQSESSQVSLSTSEQFAYEASEDNFSHDEFRAQNAYQSNVYQTNEYSTKSGPSVKSIIYYSDDSDSQETKREGQTNNNQMVNASSKSKSFLNRELRQAKASRRPPKRGTQSFNNEESSPGFLQMRTRQEINSVGVMRTEAITQTSELLISKRIYASSDNSQGMPSNKANQVEESNQGLKNSVKPNQDNFKQAKTDKTKLMSKQNQDMEVQEQSKVLKLVQSNSLIIDSDIGQYQLVQTNSVELKSLPEFFPKTKKANPTRKRRSSRSCCRCCSRCSTRKRSLKKPVISEKTKKRACENCECNPTVDKNQKVIGGMPNSGKCNVREILDILQKTLAGLEKQINIKKGCKGSNKKKTVKSTKPKSSKGHAQHNKIPNQYVNQVGTQNIPYKQGNSLSDHDQPLDTFQNHPYLHNKTVPANVGAPTNIYQTNAYGTAGPANVENPSNIYRSNSNTNLPNSPFYKNSASPKNVGENIHQNNTIQRTALPENDPLKNGSNPAPVEVPFKNERITRSTENSYRNQETLNEPIKYINEPHEQSNYSKEDYNNQILSQSFNQTYTTPQCIRNNPQMDGFQESAFARTPMTDSAYNQGSRDTTNSTSQNSKKMCKGPECCPYRSLYKVDDGLINRGVVTFQDCEKICKESSSPNDVPNKGTTNQGPLQICTNFAYPENLKQFSSWANQTNSISNKAPSYPTGNDSPRINPECACGYEQKEKEKVCNGPEYCPYQSRFRADVAPNSRGGVTFQDCDKSCIEMSGRNYEDPVKVCENYPIPETILYLKSWDNSIYPILNRTQVLRKKNAITECDPECFFEQKQRQVPFQKGGTADNYKDFCENPYCPENNSFKNVSRSERRQTCQELRSSKWENPNRPENELVYRTFTHYHQEEPLYQEELHESPERQVICELGSEEDSNYSDAQQCFNSSSYIKRSYSTEECSPNCPTIPKMSNQDDKRKESPRITKVSTSRRNRNSDRVTNNRLHGAPKKDNLCNNSQFENGIFSDKKKHIDIMKGNQK